MLENLEQLEKPNFDTMIPPQETISVIIPLYGFFEDKTIPDLNYEVLRMSLLRVRSFYHPLYYIFVAERGRIDKKVIEVLYEKSLGGNTRGIEVEQYATYPMYLEEGLKYAIEETKSNYFICVNPWIMLKKNTIDSILERINKTDVSLCSGYNVRKVDVSAEEFESVNFVPAKEFKELDIDLFVMKRSLAEQLTFDTTYKTKKVFERDLWQSINSKGYFTITSQIAPIYLFDIDWKSIESINDFNQDIQYFESKWRFNPGLKYG